MTKYRLSNTAKEDLIQIHQYGVLKFGMRQSDVYYESFFREFETICERPYSYEAIDHIKKGYRRCVCGSDSIYFKINESTIDIMTIIGKQDF